MCEVVLILFLRLKLDMFCFVLIVFCIMLIDKVVIVVLKCVGCMVMVCKLLR